MQSINLCHPKDAELPEHRLLKFIIISREKKEEEKHTFVIRGVDGRNVVGSRFPFPFRTRSPSLIVNNYW
jgi:hypothetical protein